VTATNLRLDPNTVTRFVLEDFQSLSTDEREALRGDDRLRHKLEDRFVDAIGDWPHAAECAVDAWREWREQQ
jgi:hypothetical protein